MATLVTWDEHTSGGRPQGGTIAEIVLSQVTNLVSAERPLMSVIGRDSVQGTFIELLSDSFASRGANAVAEGIAFTGPALTQPSRHYVHVQSFYDGGVVSDEQRLVRHYNGDPWSYQVAKTLQEHMNDIEHALHRGSAVTGATNAARQLQGLLNIFANQSGTATYTSSSGTTLTEEVFVDYIQSFRNQQLAVRPTVAFVNTWLKRTISEFSTKITRNIDAAEKIQRLIVEQHESDFGLLNIIYSEDQLVSGTKTTSGNSIAFIDPSFFKVGWLRAPMVEQLSRDGLRDRFQINSQATLMYSHEKGGGGAVGLVPYIGQA